MNSHQGSNRYPRRPKAEKPVPAFRVTSAPNLDSFGITESDLVSTSTGPLKIIVGVALVFITLIKLLGAISMGCGGALAVIGFLLSCAVNPVGPKMLAFGFGGIAFGYASKRFEGWITWSPLKKAFGRRDYLKALREYGTYLSFVENARLEIEWTQLSGRQFEVKIAKYFTLHGYDAHISGGSYDGGVDIKLYEKSTLVGIVQCKAHKNKITPNDVRAFCQPKHAYKVPKVYLACLHGCTAEAQRIADSEGIEVLTLADYLRFYKDIQKKLP